MVEDTLSTEEWLSRTEGLVPRALDKAREVKCFAGRWKVIISKLEQVPSRLSNLSTHPCFSKNALCKEQLHAVSKTLNEAIELAELCAKETHEGKLQMQSKLDSLTGKLDLNLRDCGLLIKTQVLGDVTYSSNAGTHGNIQELLARLQIGHMEDKHKALDALVEIMKVDEKSVLAIIGQSNISVLVLLLNATNLKMREKSITIICSLVEFSTRENYLVPENVVPPLIRLLEFGNVDCKEKSIIALQRLSMSVTISQAIVEHGGIKPLIEICRASNSVLQAAAACTLRNISRVPDSKHALYEQGIVRAMISVLDHGILGGSKENAAECLQNLTVNDDRFKKSVISEGGIRSLLAYLDNNPIPQAHAVEALRNLVGLISTDILISQGLIPRLVRVLKSGSVGAREAAASVICKICSSTETKRLVGEAGIIPLLVKMLEAKANSARETAAQAVASLMTDKHNCREVKNDDRSVPNLVALLDPSPHNTAKKYAVSCLLLLSLSRKCKKLMVSYGAIGYLKKLSEMEAFGAENLLERLEQRGLKSFFSRE